MKFSTLSQRTTTWQTLPLILNAQPFGLKAVLIQMVLLYPTRHSTVIHKSENQFNSKHSSTIVETYSISVVFGWWSYNRSNWGCLVLVEDCNTLFCVCRMYKIQLSLFQLVKARMLPLAAICWSLSPSSIVPAHTDPVLFHFVEMFYYVAVQPILGWKAV